MWQGLYLIAFVLIGAPAMIGLMLQSKGKFDTFLLCISIAGFFFLSIITIAYGVDLIINS